MKSIFSISEFNDDISDWNVSSLADGQHMFLGSGMAKK